jgi:hypothetical protein
LIVNSLIITGSFLDGKSVEFTQKKLNMHELIVNFLCCSHGGGGGWSAYLAEKVKSEYVTDSSSHLATVFSICQ